MEQCASVSLQSASYVTWHSRHIGWTFGKIMIQGKIARLGKRSIKAHSWWEGARKSKRWATLQCTFDHCHCLPQCVRYGNAFILNYRAIGNMLALFYGTAQALTKSTNCDNELEVMKVGIPHIADEVSLVSCMSLLLTCHFNMLGMPSNELLPYRIY